jgi:hypothetical protein
MEDNFKLLHQIFDSPPEGCIDMKIYSTCIWTYIRRMYGHTFDACIDRHTFDSCPCTNDAALSKFLTSSENNFINFSK